MRVTLKSYAQGLRKLPARTWAKHPVRHASRAQLIHSKLAGSLLLVLIYHSAGF